MGLLTPLAAASALNRSAFHPSLRINLLWDHPGMFAYLANSSQDGQSQCHELVTQTSEPRRRGLPPPNFRSASNQLPSLLFIVVIVVVVVSVSRGVLAGDLEKFGPPRIRGFRSE